MAVMAIDNRRQWMILDDIRTGYTRCASIDMRLLFSRIYCDAQVLFEIKTDSANAAHPQLSARRQE